MGVEGRVKRTYSSKGHFGSTTIYVNEEQALALDKLSEKNEFNAYFWAEKVEWMNNGDYTKDGEKVFRINGGHNIIGRGDYLGMKGMGGRKFEIKFKSGDVIVSDNIWHQGNIPEELKHILTDNVESMIEL